MAEVGNANDQSSEENSLQDLPNIERYEEENAAKKSAGNRPNEQLLRLGSLISKTNSNSREIPSYDSVVNEPSRNEEIKLDIGNTKPPSYDCIVKQNSEFPSSSQLPRYRDVGGLADAPPPYHTIFTDSVLVRAINALSDETRVEEHVAGHHCRVSMILSHVILPFLVLLFVIVLPIMMITMGILFIHDCPKQPRIPIYLIVLGFFQMLECCGRLGYKIFHNHNHQRNTWRERYHRKDPLIYFVIVWFVIGSMWVYQTDPNCRGQGCRNDSQSWNSTHNETTTMANLIKHNGDYCNNILYTFAFWVITSYYGTIGLFGFLFFIDVVVRSISRCCCS